MSAFLQRPPADWVASNALAFAIRDSFPVSEGHTLVVPKREFAAWFEATPAERVALFELVDVVKAKLDQGPSASGQKPWASAKPRSARHSDAA